MSIPKIIIDCDPGGDDIFALIWLFSVFKEGKCDLIAITTCGGNVNFKQTYTNVWKLMKLFNINVPVGKGDEFSDKKDASHFHGADGVGGVLDDVNTDDIIPIENAPLSRDIIIDALIKHKNEVSILAIGPLSNLFSVGQVLKFAKNIIIMGGAIHIPGNVSSQAEFNFKYNPVAANYVISNYKTIIIPLDVTTKVVTTVDLMTQAGIEQSEIINLAKFMTKTNQKHLQCKSGFHVHDAFVVAMFFYPNIFTLKSHDACVETVECNCVGRLVVDDRLKMSTNNLTLVAVDVDVEKFLTVFLNGLHALCGLQN